MWRGNTPLLMLRWTVWAMKMKTSTVRAGKRPLPVQHLSVQHCISLKYRMSLKYDNTTLCIYVVDVWQLTLLTCAFCRCVVTDLGAFVLINVYAPNAGDRKSDNGRIAYKVRFLDALKQKADLLRDAGREVRQ